MKTATGKIKSSPIGEGSPDADLTKEELRSIVENAGRDLYLVEQVYDKNAYCSEESEYHRNSGYNLKILTIK